MEENFNNHFYFNKLLREESIEDARSVSLYPYNRLQIYFIYHFYMHE